ncbi:signal peptidase I [Pseudonocardia bannensis]|uniref:Signal peptidase I n=2 Tax=Pseudonocardia bannensis TaxID=630973 RepID=A0A848DLQ5_9PSEU|nr:signal peptidase I [Pseudonocardia bannensis]
MVGIRLLGFEPVRIPSNSMAPTLAAGDHVVLDHREFTPARGDLIAFTDPTGATRDGLMVKRVAAVAGDEVGLEDGVLVVNGAAVVEPYADRSRLDGVYLGPLVVPAGKLFVLGDNRGDSVDSRTFGPIDAGTVEGRIELRLFPDPGPL